MSKRADYIERIEIKGLWGRRNVTWDLNPDVNILSGINGIGKSTIINMAVGALQQLTNASLSEKIKAEVNITFTPADATYIPFNVIRSFDRPLLHTDLLEKLADNRVKTELDWQLYQLQRQYLDYQVNIGNRMIELLQSPSADDREKATELSKSKALFQDIVDSLFKDTHKTIDRRSNEIVLIQADERLEPYCLSSGEKQMLVILLTVLIQDYKHCVLLMDEPEVSLHIEWQQQLISLVRQLNPNVQIVLTTHSPAVIMNGWMDKVTEVSDISEDPLIDKGENSNNG
jgi:energy-coupling factor transporter ATP-binding protein EcfA2